MQKSFSKTMYDSLCLLRIIHALAIPLRVECLQLGIGQVSMLGSTTTTGYAGLALCRPAPFGITWRYAICTFFFELKVLLSTQLGIGRVSMLGPPPLVMSDLHFIDPHPLVSRCVRALLIKLSCYTCVSLHRFYALCVCHLVVRCLSW